MSAVGLPLAVITGAAHRVGREIALSLARAGYAIGLHYHGAEEESRATAERIQNAYQVPVYRLRADLTIPQEITHLFAAAAELPHPLRVLVNSAAIMPRVPLGEMDLATWDSVMNLNLRAPWLCSQAAAALMQAGGSIINISDSGADRTWTGYPAYVISKGALEHLTRIMARAYAPLVRVNAVAPGLILPAAGMDPQEWDRLVQRLPLGQAGQPADVAEAVLYLVRSQHVTGTTIVVDGGYQLL